MRIGVGLDGVAADAEQALQLQGGECAGDGLDGAVASRLTSCLEEGAGESGATGAGGGGEAEQEPGGLPESGSVGDGPEPGRHGPDLRCLSGRAFSIWRGVGTVRARSADATRSSPREAQLHHIAEQVGAGGEDLGVDRGEARAIHGGEDGRPKPDPAGGVVPGAGGDDHPEACEDPHGFSGRPIRGGDPEVAEDLGVGSSAVEDRARPNGGGEHREGPPGDLSPADPGGDRHAGEAEVIEHRRGRAGPRPGDLDGAGDPRPNGVRTWVSGPPPRPPTPRCRRGLVNRRGGCYVLDQMVLVSRYRRSGY